LRFGNTSIIFLASGFSLREVARAEAADSWLGRLLPPKPHYSIVSTPTPVVYALVSVLASYAESGFDRWPRCYCILILLRINLSMY